MNQKTIMYAAYTFIAFALLSKFSGGAVTAMAKKAPAPKAAPAAAQPKKKKSNFFSKALGFGRKLIGFDADGNPVYEAASADEMSVI